MVVEITVLAAQVVLAAALEGITMVLAVLETLVKATTVGPMLTLLEQAAEVEALEVLVLLLRLMQVGLEALDYVP